MILVVEIAAGIAIGLTLFRVFENEISGLLSILITAGFFGLPILGITVGLYYYGAEIGTFLLGLPLVIGGLLLAYVVLVLIIMFLTFNVRGGLAVQAAFGKWAKHAYWTMLITADLIIISLSIQNKLLLPLICLIPGLALYFWNHLLPSIEIKKKATETIEEKKEEDNNAA